MNTPSFVSSLRSSQVFVTNIMRKYESELQHTSLEGHLDQLLEDEERILRKEEIKGEDGGSISSVSLEDERMAKRRSKMGGLGSLDFDDEDDHVSVMSLTTGFLPANRIFNALKEAKHLRLSRVQLLAVMR